MTTKQFNSGWYYAQKGGRVTHYFERWTANADFGVSRCGRTALLTWLNADDQIPHCKNCNHHQGTEL